MANKFLTINSDQLKNKIALNIQKQTDKVGKSIVKKASYALYEHIKEQAGQELNTRKQFYLNNLQIKETPANGGYRIILRSPAAFIEHGLEARQLRDSMLSKGETKRVIPLSDGPLSGTNKAKKIAAAGSVRFRTMTLNQVSTMWQTKMIKGINLFKEAKVWFASNLKAGAWTKK